ncbi:MAG: alkaline phosphatase family protein [Gemmatimonadetes bacterium]|nr:alkaline phosphatase family protein [Gemmatimonadota bacterium]
MPVIILVADGARPDTLAAAMDRGELPAMSQLRAEGGAHVVTTCWPSVTGMAYAPFLMGMYPGHVGLPGLRWFDRSRRIGRFMGHSRSYVGSGMRHVDADLTGEARTAYELTERRLGALSVIHRGLPWGDRLGFGAAFALRAARTHFRGNVRGWLGIDREIGQAVAHRIRRDRPQFVFAAFTGIDKTSHSEGHDAPVVRDAMRIVDDAVAEIRQDAERADQWRDMHLWIVSDHGHSPVAQHDDIALWMRESGHRVLAHPWTLGSGHDVAVMVSGNAMAHLYLDLAARAPRGWDALRPHWQGTLEGLLARPSVDLVIAPLSTTRAEVHGRGRGHGTIAHEAGWYRYEPVSGDPLGTGALAASDPTGAWDATRPSDYPDVLVQVVSMLRSSRIGDLMVSAARDWDLRAKYEPIPHRSSHGALHRDHMLVPLLLNTPSVSTPRRTVDVMPTAMRALGVAPPTAVDGAIFL